MLEMLLRDDVNLVEVDMCDFGMKSSDAEGEGFVRKKTKIFTNLLEVPKRVPRNCAGDHRHVNFNGGRAKESSFTVVLLARRFASASLHGCRTPSSALTR